MSYNCFLDSPTYVFYPLTNPPHSKLLVVSFEWPTNECCTYCCCLIMILSIFICSENENIIWTKIYSSISEHLQRFCSSQKPCHLLFIWGTAADSGYWRNCGEICKEYSKPPIRHNTVRYTAIHWNPLARNCAPGYALQANLIDTFNSVHYSTDVYCDIVRNIPSRHLPRRLCQVWHSPLLDIPPF